MSGPSETETLKILMATPEVDPFIKIGGLADVVGALPKELGALGHDVRIICPLYGSVKRMGEWKELPGVLIVNLGYGAEYGKVWEVKLPDVAATFYFIEHEVYFAREEVYAGPWGDHDDNDRRFAFLSRAAIDLCYFLEWKPDVIHCHDWTTGLVPVMLNTSERGREMENVATVMTIHNLKFQGIFRREVIQHARIPGDYFRSDGLESMGFVNMMKGGLYHATKITTVSPTYAQEIQGPVGGCGLHFVLKYRAADLIGILNGIDVDAWNPVTDPHLEQNFSVQDLGGKQACKAALQREMHLEIDTGKPVFGVVARLFGQKGLDMLASIIEGLMEHTDAQIALLGTGDPKLEHQFSHAAYLYPGRVGVYIGFSNPLAHQVIAGSDFLIMPSRFEPCGLTQMYSMRYGTLPVVRNTGGLSDTVDQFTLEEGAGTGFKFEESSGHALFHTMDWAHSVFHTDPEAIREMQIRGMNRDSSWRQSAKDYVDVYRWAVQARQPTN